MADDGPPARDPVQLAYQHDGAHSRACPRCRAQPYEPCINPINDQAAKMPCLARLTDRESNR